MNEKKKQHIYMASLEQGEQITFKQVENIVFLC